MYVNLYQLVKSTLVLEMAYLNKISVVMICASCNGVALNEGFSAMTVRRIATEAQTSTGQVHHHFASNSFESRSIC
jgi:hypothetical protein